MRLIKTALEYRSIDELNDVPPGLRGIYALYKRRGKSYDVVYIGMSADGIIRKRLYSHKRNRINDWTHFSYYEVWDNITDVEIQELEGLFRQLYQFDSRTNALNKQQTYKPLVKVRRETERTLNLKHISKKLLST
ncbi:MAG: GIY-YIG nuclease family protein [Endozoicomonas sp.]|uniref:GIY-YIG nuclease family protein n=1 Tax=Endozoicomonas sp. TaxID=1892382 RepID=UPI003D9BF1E6